MRSTHGMIRNNLQGDFALLWFRVFIQRVVSCPSFVNENTTTKFGKLISTTIGQSKHYSQGKRTNQLAKPHAL